MALASGSGISCPNGGLFYVCQGNSTQFLGCCNSDPCSDGSGICPDSNLRNTSYSASLYDSIPTQACVDEGDWYTCAYTSPPFMGCCVTNPCATGGCYGDNVTAARLSDNGNNAAAFETTQASTPTSTSTSSPSASSSSLAGDDHTHVSSLSTGAIVGIAIGSAIAALIVGILLFCLYKRHERNKKHVLAGQGQAAPHGTPGMGNASPYQDSTGFPSPQFQHPGGMSEHKTATNMAGSMPNSPTYHAQQRPTSQAVSWLSRLSGQQGGASYDNPSVSSLGSSLGTGRHAVYNQRPPPQYEGMGLNPVSEMDGAEVARPTWELDGAPSPPGSAGLAPGRGSHGNEHSYGSGYRHVSTRDDRGA